MMSLLLSLEDALPPEQQTPWPGWPA